MSSETQSAGIVLARIKAAMQRALEEAGTTASTTSITPTPITGPHLGGLPVLMDTHMIDLIPDPRSPSRAQRRAKRGHPQHMTQRPSSKSYMRDGKLVMHPATWAALRARLARDPPG